MAVMTTLMVLTAFAGFTLLQLGCSEPKNTSSIIINNVISLVISAVLFWATGYAFAFGTSANSFISHSKFFLIDATTAQYDSWLYQFALLAIFIAIVNGGFAERMHFWIYPLLSLFMAGFFYPVSTHWAWHAKGWLAEGIKNTNKQLITYKDVGGASIIHVSAGSAALVAAILLGARVKRGKEMKAVGGETNTNIFLGAFLVLIGLAAKNVASYTNVTQQSLSAVNSILASFSSAICAFALKRTGFCGRNWNTKTLLNGAIMGMVSVSANPGDYRPYGGFAIGVVSGCAYVIWNVLLESCRLDDISDTIAVHLGGGILGALAGPLFSKTKGVFYDGAVENFQLFGWNLLGCSAYFAWHAIAVFFVTVAFFCFGKMAYHPRKEVHLLGLDIYEHDEPAYPTKETFPVPEIPSDLPALTDMRATISGTHFYGKGFDNAAYGETNTF